MALVLSRKAGEKLIVNGNTVIEIRRITGNTVTVAIDAPESVVVLRSELTEPQGGGK